MSEAFWETNIIYKTVAGSHAYGLATEESDYDARGVCIPSRRSLLGLTPFEQREESGEAGDRVIYGLGKFVRLGLACNPSIIELLYTEPHFVLFINEYGKELLSHRDLFLTRQVRHTFASYAISQLRRIERHHRWIVNPPDHQPTQEEFGGWFTGSRYRFPDSDAERSYRAALKHWNEYQTWQRNRNPARAELERRFGYDTKHAMHLLRLLRMGMEILETGQVHVYRPDREWLLAVRNGLLSYEALVGLAGSYETRLAGLSATSRLPVAPDVDAAEQMVVEMHDRFLKEGRVAQ